MAETYSGLGDGADTRVEKFIARTLRFNQALVAATERLGLPRVDVGGASSLDALVDVCLTRLV